MASMVRWPPLSIPALRRSEAEVGKQLAEFARSAAFTPRRRVYPPISMFSRTVRSGKMLETWGT